MTSVKTVTTPGGVKVGIAEDGRCTCDCGNECPLGKTGMMLRCTEAELTDGTPYDEDND